MSRHALLAKCFDKRGTLIAQATNSYTRTHPLMAKFGREVGQSERVYLHAELAALLKCGDRKPYKLFVERRKKDGSYGTAKPCAICERAIAAWGVKRVEYTVG